MATIIDGKLIAKEIKENVKCDVQDCYNTPRLAVIIVGNNPASKTYVKNKSKDCEECGIICNEYMLAEDVGQEFLVDLIKELNEDKHVDGILCQLPLPDGYDYDESEVLETIAPTKDVDCFNPYNVGRMYTGDEVFLPCTPAGVMDMLDYYNIDVEGKNCVVIGRSNIVGKPMANMLTMANGTVTLCHSRTKNLAEFTKNADILVSAVGKAKFIKADMVKDGAVVIDVGMNRDENGKLCGDVDFEDVELKASYITPVPGGVGPMTRAMLMLNTLNANRFNVYKTLRGD